MRFLAINTRVVRRTNALLGHAYGRDFVYDEMVLTGPGEKGEAIARGMAAAGSGMDKEDAPKPGEGPSREEREKGFYDVLFFGRTAAGQTLRVAVSGDRDPGYGSTSKMITEAALCLLKDDVPNLGGLTTPGAALGDTLIARLQARAGLKFVVES